MLLCTNREQTGVFQTEAGTADAAELPERRHLIMVSGRSFQIESFSRITSSSPAVTTTRISTSNSAAYFRNEENNISQRARFSMQSRPKSSMAKPRDVPQFVAPR